MMINKRLIGTIGTSKKYVAGKVLLQWCCLVANIVMMTSITYLLQHLFYKTADTNSMIVTFVIVVVALIIRFICTIGASRMSYCSSREVKKILREKIYQKLLRIGVSYKEQVKTSEVVQVAVEGVEQLENYFGSYLPQFFLCYAGTFDIVYLSMFYQCVISSSFAYLCTVYSDSDCRSTDLGKKIIE